MEETESGLVLLPNEILRTILFYANSARSVRQVSKRLKLIDESLQATRIAWLDEKFPKWRQDPKTVFSNPDVDINTIWLVFKLTNSNYRTLAETTPDPDIFREIINLGYNDVDVIIINAIRLRLLDIALQKLDYVRGVCFRLLSVVGTQFMAEFDSLFYSNIAEEAAEMGYIDLVRLCIDEGAENFREIATHAAKGGFIKIVELIIDLGLDDFCSIGTYAARYGHMDIVNLALNNCLDSEEFARAAAEHGQLEVLKLIISYYGVSYDAYNYHSSVYYATINNHMNIILFAVDHGYRDFNEIAKFAVSTEVLNFAVQNGADDYDAIAESAAKTGDFDLVKLALEHGATLIDVISYYAAERGDIEMLNLVINRPSISFNLISLGGARGGSIATVKLAFDLGADNYNNVAYLAAGEGYLNIVKLAIAKNRNPSSFGNIRYEIIANKAAENGYKNIVEWAMAHGANNFNEIAYVAAHHNNISIVRLAINNGADNFNAIALSGANKGYTDIVAIALDNGADNFAAIADLACNHHVSFSVLELVAIRIGWKNISESLM
jgi:hypothetical protein